MIFMVDLESIMLFYIRLWLMCTFTIRLLGSKYLGGKYPAKHKIYKLSYHIDCRGVFILPSRSLYTFFLDEIIVYGDILDGLYEWNFDTQTLKISQVFILYKCVCFISVYPFRIWWGLSSFSICKYFVGLIVRGGYFNMFPNLRLIS